MPAGLIELTPELTRRCRVEQGEVGSTPGSKDLGLRSCNVKWAGVIGFRQARDRSGVVYLLAWHQTLGRLRAPAGHLVSARAVGWSSPTTPARRLRMVADDVHRFILVGQALWTAIVPTGLSSRAFGDRPAQGFRGRPRLARLVADVFDLGAARTAPQDDFGPMADQHHGETLLRIRPYVASPSGTLGSVRDLRLLGYRFGGRLAEHHLVHLAEDHPSR